MAKNKSKKHSDLLLDGVLAAIRMKGKNMYWSKSLNCNVVEGLKLDERIDD